MKQFKNSDGEVWIATAREEQTPRHHTRWHLVFHPVNQGEAMLPLPEIRWQTRETAERTLASMSLFELRRRLKVARARAVANV
jgi:hypothetical protein